MITVTFLVSLICGVVLCFFGYRIFRTAMAFSGFILGAGIGYFIYSMFGDKLPAAQNGVWVLVFMGVGGILLGFLSFHIYKAALFYVSMFFTAYIVLKAFLMTMGSGIGVTAFIMVLIGRTGIGGAADSLSDVAVGESGTVGSSVAAMLEKLPGTTQTDKLLIVFGVALVLGAIVGGIVLIMQKPAIIVVTAVYGGLLITQGIFSLIMNTDFFDLSAQSLVNSFAGGSGRPALSALVAIAFIVLGITAQFRTPAKSGRKRRGPS